jgi:hypothetical protein
MKKYLFLLAAGIAFQSTPSIASDTSCGREYALDVEHCTQEALLQNLTSKERGAWQRACVSIAKYDKDICETGAGNTCQEDCQLVYDGAVLSCQQTYNPFISACGSDLVCQAPYQSFLASCIAGATNNLNSCISTCPL